MTRIILIFTITYVLASSCSSARTGRVAVPPAYLPESKGLYDTIVLMDSLLFDAYNTCKIEVFRSLLSDDLEFYHDLGGLSRSKSDIVQSVKTNICGKVTREVLAAGMEVYRIAGYGAVQIGFHRFHNHQEKGKGPSAFSRFVHTWHFEDGVWRLSRVISLH